MAEPSFIDELARAIPVVVGGILAVGGGLFGQYLTHRLTANRDQSNRRRDRLESLVKALYANEHWIEDKRTAMIFRNEDHDTHSPLDEARMLQTLHFPELAQEMIAVMEAQQPMLEFISKQHIDRMANKATWQKNWDTAPWMQAYKKYVLAVGVATLKCAKLMRESTK